MKTREFKKAENLLKDYKNMICKIEMYEDEIKIIESQYEGCSAINYDEKTGATNKFNSVVENEIIKREEKTKNIKEILTEIKIKKNRLDYAIKSLKAQEERDLINLRYINSPQISWGSIARHLGYNKDHCRKVIEPRAISKIANFMFHENGIQERLKI